MSVEVVLIARAAEPVTVPSVRRGDRRHVMVIGAIDISTAPELDRLLRHHLAALPVGDVLVVDLSWVSHFSAAGLHVLSGTAATARERRVGFRIGRTSRQVDRILEVCGVAPARIGAP